jgi:two-component system, OmpR family, phosphate regulon sensor histidine kinase PhoR
MSLSIKWKFFGALFFVSAAAVVIAGLVIAKRTENRMLRQVEEGLTAETKLIAEYFQDIPLQDNNWKNIDSLTDFLGQKVSARVTIIDTSGKVLGDSYKSGPELLAVENHLSRPEVQEALKVGIGSQVRFSQTVKMKMFYLAIPILQDGNLSGFARLALPLTQVSRQTYQIIKYVVVSTFLALLFSLALSIILASRLTKPLKLMAESAKQIARGDFALKIRPKGRDEIAELGNYFNLMAEELQSTLERLKNEKLQLDSILSNMREGVMALGPTGEILIANDSLKQMFQLKDSPLGKAYYEVLRQPGLNALIKETLWQHSTKTDEFSLGYPDERSFMVHSISLKAERAGEVSAILVLFDITRLKKLEKIRKDFVANASHELRTPLTSIKGFVEALQDGAIDDPLQTRQFLEIISRQAERMGKIITDMLLLSEIESEGFQLKLEEFRINDLIREIFKPFQAQADSKNIALELNLQEPEKKVKMDRDKISQVISNLLDNALKFTNSGGKVAIQVEDHRNEVIIQVKDSGIGIPSTDLSRIFERFYTIDKSRSRELGGTGLGLSIVKHIVEAHGGKVWVESELNKGSVFYFSLPQ